MPVKCPTCNGKLSDVIGWPSEQRRICMACGAQVRVESWADDVPKDCKT